MTPSVTMLLEVARIDVSNFVDLGIERIGRYNWFLERVGSPKMDRVEDSDGRMPVATPQRRPSYRRSMGLIRFPRSQSCCGYSRAVRCSRCLPSRTALQSLLGPMSLVRRSTQGRPCSLASRRFSEVQGRGRSKFTLSLQALCNVRTRLSVGLVVEPCLSFFANDEAGTISEGFGP